MFVICREKGNSTNNHKNKNNKKIIGSMYKCMCLGMCEGEKLRGMTVGRGVKNFRFILHI